MMNQPLFSLPKFLVSFFFIALIFLIVIPISTNAAESKNITSDCRLFFDLKSKKYITNQKENCLFLNREKNPWEVEISLDGENFSKKSPNSIELENEGKNQIWIRLAAPGHSWFFLQVMDVFLDTTSPNTELHLENVHSFYFDPNTKKNYLPQRTLLAFSASDSLAGIEKIEYSWNPSLSSFSLYEKPISILPQEKESQLSVRSTDRVGNQETPKIWNFTVDGTPPTSRLTFFSVKNSILEEEGRKYMVIQDKSCLSIQAQDSGSGVAKTFYSIDGGEYSLYSGCFYLVKEGPHLVKFYSEDYTDNVESEKKVFLYTISQAPKTWVILHKEKVQKQAQGKYIVSPGFSIHLETRKNRIGIDRIEYRLSPLEKFSSYSSPVFFFEPGLYQVQYRAVDSIGNVEPFQTTEFEVKEL